MASGQRSELLMKVKGHNKVKFLFFSAEAFPTWATVLLVLLVVLVLIAVSAGLLYHFRDIFKSGESQNVLTVLSSRLTHCLIFSQSL